MSSKSKKVRIEQRRILETRLELRLKKLAEKGVSKEDAQRDPLVKNLKSQIRETNVRIAAFEKNIKLAQTLAQAKAQKVAELSAKKEEKPKPHAEPAAEQPKKHKEKAESHHDSVASEAPKKKAAVAADKEPKKKAPAADGEAAPKKTKAKKEESKTK
jgi:hypothetical protein